MKTQNTLLALGRVRDDADFVQFLTHAGYIYTDASGFYSLTTLGTLALERLESRIDNALKLQDYGKISLSLLQKDSLWKTTGRAEDYGSELMSVTLQSGQVMRLSATAEEQITCLMQNYFQGRVADHALYQIGTKWRDELRARAGLVRAREFRMMDLYLFHQSSERMLSEYERARDTLFSVVNNLGLSAKMEEADCGEIGGQKSEELQVSTSLSDDGWLEVGHSFALGTKYTEAFSYTGQQGSAVHMSCHGLGTTRLLAVLLRSLWTGGKLCGNSKFSVADDVIVTWSDQGDITARAEGLYKRLRERGRCVLWENRFKRAGQALSASETLGAARRFVITERTGTQIEHTYFEQGTTELLDHEDSVLD